MNWKDASGEEGSKLMLLAAMTQLAQPLLRLQLAREMLTDALL